MSKLWNKEDYLSDVKNKVEEHQPKSDIVAYISWAFSLPFPTYSHLYG
jgi:hypothetical protein